MASDRTRHLYQMPFMDRNQEQSLQPLSGESVNQSQRKMTSTNQRSYQIPVVEESLNRNPIQMRTSSDIKGCLIRIREKEVKVELAARCEHLMAGFGETFDSNGGKSLDHQKTISEELLNIKAIEQRLRLDPITENRVKPIKSTATQRQLHFQQKQRQMQPLENGNQEQLKSLLAKLRQRHKPERCQKELDLINKNCVI